MDAQDEFLRRITKSNAMRFAKMPARRRGMSHGPTWAESYYDDHADEDARLAQECGVKGGQGRDDASSCALIAGWCLVIGAGVVVVALLAGMLLS